MPKTPKQIYTCLGNPHHLDDLYLLLPVVWTISKNAEIGDIAIFYLTAPISAIVGFGTVMEKPWYNQFSEWREKYFADIAEIIMFDQDRFITNRQMRLLFPEWRYIRQPRVSVAAPSEIIKPFWKLLQQQK